MSLASVALEYQKLGLHPIVERPNSKLPLEPAWQKSTFRSPTAVAAAFDAAPDGAGIGTVTCGFIVLDLDVREGVNGIESLSKLPPLPETLTAQTPSGGRHLFFKLPAGSPEVKNSVSKLGPGIDVRGTGGQVVLPPTEIDGRRYEWAPGPQEMAELPREWLDLLVNARIEEASQQLDAELARARFQTVRRSSDVAHEAERRRNYMATLTEPSIQGQGGTAVFMRAVAHAKQMSRNADEAAEALAEWNERCAQPPWSSADIRRALANSTAKYGEGLDRPNPAEAAPPAAAPAGPDPAAADVAWVESMQAYVTRDRRSGVWNLTNPLTEKGAVGALVARGIAAPAARALLKNWRVTMAYRVDCDPTQPPTFQQDGQTVLNNFVPSTVKPEPAPFPVLDEVLGFLTCGDPAAKAWLMNWLAFALQNPARPMRTVPVVYGAQRTGKSLLARAMTTLLGDENCAAVRNEDIKGRFTSHFVTKLFVTVGEIEAGEVNHATSTLKYLTGEPTLVFEAKGSAAFHVPNRIKMLATSNQTLPVALEGEADSRWVLFKQLNPPSAEYTARMDSLFNQATNDWSEEGRRELAGFAAHLLALPVDPVMARTVYANAARAGAVEASRSSVEQFVEAVNGSSLDAVWLAHVPEYERTGSPFAHMDIPGHEHMTSVAAVYATYRAFCKASGLQPLGTGRFPGELERHAPRWTRHKTSSSVLATRPWVYVGLPRDRKLRLPYLPLESRQAVLNLPKPADPKASMAAAVANVQQAFGLTSPDEEDES